MRTAYAIGLSVAAGALVFACAKGDAGTVPGSSGDDGELDAGVSSGEDGSVDYNGDSGAKDGGGDSGIVDAGPKCDDDDAGCVVSGAVGLCAVGNHHCDDAGASVCTSAVTTQACYSGGASTRNLGECHDGTQSCIGTAPGTCAGEVLPAAHENCFNNLDDDCDGLINDGCPAAASLGAVVALAGAGGGGGGQHDVLCPAGALVTRVDSWFDNKDAKGSGVSIYCATPTLVQNAASYSMTLAANTPAPYGTEHGSASPSIQRSDDCGISGLVGITYSILNVDTWVEAMGHHCSSGSVALNADNTIGIAFTRIPYGNPPGDYNSYGTPPGTDTTRDCSSLGANYVAVGYRVRDGAYLDNLTLLCAPLGVTYKAGTPDP